MIESTLTVFQKMILTFFVQKIAIKDIKQFGKVGGLLTKSERSRGKVDYPSKSGQSPIFSSFLGKWTVQRMIQ